MIERQSVKLRNKFCKSADDLDKVVNMLNILALRDESSLILFRIFPTKVVTRGLGGVQYDR